jgi:hypothetical protein
LTTLRDAYDQLSRLLPEVEPFEALERAEAHRACWRPPAVCVILLVESHLITGAADLERRFSAPGSTGAGWYDFATLWVRLASPFEPNGPATVSAAPSIIRRWLIQSLARLMPGGASTGSCPRADVTRPPAIDRD